VTSTNGNARSFPNGFAVPRDWREMSLIDVATLQRGFDLPVQNRVDGDVPIFAANGPVGFHNVPMCEGPGVVTGRSGTIGKVHYCDRSYWPLNTSLFVKDFHGNDPRFIFHFLRQIGLERFHEGTGVPTLNRNNVHVARVLLPPLAEQRRIAEVLDQAEALRAKRRAALAQLDSLTQSLFLDSFVANNKFPSESLELICELITDGTHYTPTYSETGVIFLSSRNVTSGYITWDDVKFIPESLHTELHRRVAPRMNDILLAKNGTTGIAAIVDRDCVFDIYVSLALLRPSARVLPIFLQQAINSPACTRQFNSSLKGIGVPNLHLKEIRKTIIPVPPIPLQREFARRVTAVEALKTAHRASLAELDALFAALQHLAFRGKL
jgi:type I restriction enzyme, S subunit